MPPLAQIIKQDGYVVALVKPQFEAGRDKVGKHGIVKDPKVHREVLEKVTQLMLEHGFSIRHLTYSPIKGGQGNIEFLAVIQRDNDPQIADDINIDQLLERTYHQLNQEPVHE